MKIIYKLRAKAKRTNKRYLFKRNNLTREKTKPNFGFVGVRNFASCFGSSRLNFQELLSMQWLKKKDRPRITVKNKATLTRCGHKRGKKKKKTTVRKTSNVQCIRFILIHFGLYNLARPHARETLLSGKALY